MSSRLPYYRMGCRRHYKILQAGVDQYDGNNEIGPVIEAYQMWAKEQGEESARQRFEQSARRLLLNVFRVGLFENPYLDPAETSKIVGLIGAASSTMTE